MQQMRKQWFFWALIIIILWAALALRLFRLDFQDIWWDEARNIDVASRPLAHVANAPELDIHPPLYFFTLHGWMAAAGQSRFATRFLSAWFGVLAAALTFQLGRRLTLEWRWLMGTLALSVASFAPYALAEAQETRMYTMSWALLAAGMVALLKALDVEADGRRWLLSGALAAAALITHYSTIFILTAWAAWLLVWMAMCNEHIPTTPSSSHRELRVNTVFGRIQCIVNRRRWSKLLGAGLVVIVLFIPVLPIALRQIPSYDNPNLTLPSLGGYLSQLYQAFTLGEFVPSPVWHWGKWVWAALIGVGAILQFWRGKRTTDWRTWSLLIVWLFGGLAIFYGVLIARSAFNARYISFILPAMWALTAWALAGWRRLAKPLPWVAVGVLLVMYLPSLHADLFDPAHFREDMTSVVRYLESNATPDDVILVDQRYPFGFYWRRWNNDFAGVPPAEPPDQAPAQYLFVDIDHVDERLTQLAGNARRVYWLTWYESDMDPRGAVTALLDAFGQRVDEQFFRGYTVRAWEMHPPTQFRLPRQFKPLNFRFDPGVTLVEGDWLGRTQPVAPGQPILVALRWRTDAPTQRPLKVSVRLKDATGATVSQDDRVLLSNRHLRTPAWSPGESALNVYLLTAPEQPNDYHLTVVLYDEETLSATGLVDGGGAEPTIGSVIIRQ